MSCEISRRGSTGIALKPCFICVRALVARAMNNLLILGRKARDTGEKADTSVFCEGESAQVVLIPAPDAGMKHRHQRNPRLAAQLFHVWLCPGWYWE